jgi:putative spermidine/putrescine transport system ATP-binding protein
MPNLLMSIYAGQNAPKVGETVKATIKPEALMLLSKETVAA